MRIESLYSEGSALPAWCSCRLSAVEAAHLMVLLMRARARGREGLAGSKDQDIVPTRRGGLGSEEWHPVDYLCVLYTTTI
jgi:hypothetical protein